MMHRRASAALLAACMFSCAGASRPVVCPHELARFHSNEDAVCQVFNAEEKTPVGTCFVINAAEGYVLTNAHVTEGLPGVAVGMYKKTAPTLPKVAQIVAVDDKADLALLKVAHAYSSEVRLGSADTLLPGASVYSIGHHGDLKKITVRGSLMNRPGVLKINENRTYPDAASLQLPIGQGQSGSPVFRADTGECIGIIGAMQHYLELVRPFMRGLPPSFSIAFSSGVLATSKSIEAFLDKHKIAYRKAGAPPRALRRTAPTSDPHAILPIVPPPADLNIPR